jgi:hypothetical protein
MYVDIVRYLDHFYSYPFMPSMTGFGVDLGVHTRGHAPDLDCHKLTGNEGCSVGRSNLGRGVKGSHGRRKGRLMSSC